MGKIVQITTPIGNLGDLTARVDKALREGEDFVVEDTRVFKSLLSALDIPSAGKSVVSLHDHTKEERVVSYLNERLDKTIYLASDAGSPYVSDPAFEIVNIAINLGFEIDTFPGVSSVIAALELSGLAPIPFHFHGFMPRDKSKIRTALETMSLSKGTHSFFEGSSRVIQTLKIISESLPGHRVCVAREITKKFQQVLRFDSSDLEDNIEDLTLKGEFVIMIDIKEDKSQRTSAKTVEMAEDLVENGAHPKKLAKLLSEITGKPTKEIYQNLSSK